MSNGEAKGGSTALSTTSSVTSPATARDVGEAMAFQVVAQATSASVVDASDMLRSVAMISTAAIGTMTANMIQQISLGGGTNDPQKWQDGIEAVQQNLEKMAEIYKTIGTDASDVLKAWKDL